MWMRRVKTSMRGLRDDRGAALVEFALVVPLLMIIMCATIDFGLAVYTLNNLTAAVREGGRFAATMPSLPAANDPLINQRVFNNITNLNGLTAPALRQLITNTPPDVNGDIIVRITGYPYVPFTPLAPLIGMDTIPLNRTAIFRYERNS